MLNIPKEPYMPWQVNESEYPQNGIFTEQAEFMIRYAILAPSAHNTQPWKFKIENQCILILPDLDRIPPYADRAHREAYISLGCALGNLEVSAIHFGFLPTITYLPEDDLNNVAVRINLEGRKIDSTLNSLFPAITKRVTNRLDWSNKDIEESVLSELNKFNIDDSIEITFISDKSTKNQITQLMVEAARFAFQDKMFKAELSKWVRSNYTKRLDGMPMFGFGMSGILSLIAPFMIRHMKPGIQAGMDKKMSENTSVFMVVSAPQDNKETWIKIGKMYEYIALASLVNGVAVAPWQGVIEYDVTGKKIKELLNCCGKPLFFARMGYFQRDVRQTPRRGVAAVLSR